MFLFIPCPSYLLMNHDKSLKLNFSIHLLLFIHCEMWKNRANKRWTTHTVGNRNIRYCIAWLTPCSCSDERIAVKLFWSFTVFKYQRRCCSLWYALCKSTGRPTPAVQIMCGKTHNGSSGMVDSECPWRRLLCWCLSSWHHHDPPSKQTKSYIT